MTPSIDLAKRVPGNQSPSPLVFIVVGALVGLAWAAGFRGMMAQVTGVGSSVSWAGTFGWILLPGVAVGALLGWAEHIRRTGGRRRPWLALAPLLFASVLLPGLLDPGSMFEGGIGGGAIGIPLIAMAGGYALAGRRRWLRIGCWVIFLAPILSWSLTAESINAGLALNTPRGAWVALYFWSFIAVLGIGSAIPLRTYHLRRPVAEPGQEPSML